MRVWKKLKIRIKEHKVKIYMDFILKEVLLEIIIAMSYQKVIDLRILSLET